MILRRDVEFSSLCQEFIQLQEFQSHPGNQGRGKPSVAVEATVALTPSHKRFNITTTSLAGTRDEQDIFCFRRILEGLSVAVRCAGPRGSCITNDLKISLVVLKWPVDR